MKKTYTKKQIAEAIAYWKKQLNENIQDSGMSSLLERLNSWSKETGNYIINLAD